MAVSLPIVSEFDGKGIKSAIAEFKQLETTGQKAQFALKKAVVPATAAIAGLAAGLGSAAMAAIDDAKAQEQLALALANSTGATNADIEATEQFIGAISTATGVADDQLRPALANLARGTGDMARSQELLTVAMDVQAATGKDLETVTLALVKAENGQYDALKKLGIPLNENTLLLKDIEKQKKVVARVTQDVAAAEYNLANGLIDSKKGAEKLAAAQNKLAQETGQLNEMTAQAGDYTSNLTSLFGGAAAANAETMAGKMQIMKVQMAETKEAIGAALLPAIQQLLDFLMPLATWAQENTKVFLILAGVIGGLAGAVLAINAAMKVYQATLVIVKVAQAALNFVMAANPIGIVIVAIMALVAAFVIAYNKSETFREIIQGLFGAIKTGVEFSVNAIKGYLEFVLGFYKTIFNALANLWNNTIGKLSFTFPSWVPGLGGKGFSVPKIPMLAEGGIVTQPTLAMIGERGPEAVIPLNRANGMGNVTVNVYSTVADASFPDKIVNALRQYNRRSGVIDIAVA